MLTVSDNMVVSLEYTLRLADGRVADSSEGREPLQFIQGQGTIIPGLEKELYGMQAGEEKDIVVAPRDAYGEFDPDLFDTLPRSVFPSDMVLEPGQGFRMRTEAGQVVIAYIDHIEGDNVIVDLNHPLAGQTLYFKVKIADLREATPDELQGGCSACSGCATCGDDCECDEEE